MQVDFLNLKSQVNKLTNIIVVYGEDDYLRDRAVEQIKASLNVEFGELNCDSMRGVTMDEVISSAVILPFMTGTRFVVVKDYVAPNGHEKSEREKLVAYMKNPVYTTTLVFSVKNLVSVVDNLEFADYINCKKLDQNALERWILAFCKKEGKTISPYNARLIADYCLNDMARISTEVQKVCFYSACEITKDDIELMIEKENEVKLYELANEIANKNADMAFKIARNLIDKGTKVHVLVSSVYKTFQRMFYTVASKGMSQAEMASALGVKPFAITKAREVAQKFSPVKLKKAVEICAEADENLRHSINGNAVINYLILSLINL